MRILTLIGLMIMLSMVGCSNKTPKDASPEWVNVITTSSSTLGYSFEFVDFPKIAYRSTWVPLGPVGDTVTVHRNTAVTTFVSYGDRWLEAKTAYEHTKYRIR